MRRVWERRMFVRVRNRGGEKRDRTTERKGMRDILTS